VAQDLGEDEEEEEDVEEEEEEVDEVESDYDESSAVGTPSGPSGKTPLRLKLKLGGSGAQSPIIGQLKGRAKRGKKRARMEGERVGFIFFSANEY
jgi:hypothetical protein